MGKTALYNSHQISNAKFVTFAGYELPILYQDTGIIKEHLAVRKSCGIFDVSHMGQALISGVNTETLLSSITPTNFLDTAVGKAKYTVLLNEQASVIDDLIFYKLAENRFLVIFNAARKEVDLKWLTAQTKNFDCDFEPLNDQHLIALQGPDAVNIITKVIDMNPEDFPFMSVKEVNYNGESLYISRSGYTGEDGFEISATSSNITGIWNKLIELGVTPIGLGARDSLRMEMGFPLYGSDLSENINLSDSSLNWIITSNNNFIGKANINSEPTSKRLAIKLIDKGIMRDHMDIYALDQTQKIGVVTSGCFAPSLNYSIGQCYIDIAYAKPNSEVFVEIRGKFKKAQIVNLTYFKKEITNNS
ncbi:MAG: glycine cleavage system aminomethyltransferase GcvT [Rickettsiales bacterium]|mgnify:FL=1|jgi:aminomethyltransferase|nr:glycine cleavage system aminomethyltransferase GcvT [Rickettsiales bacterium]